MKFTDIKFSKSKRFSIGQEENSGKYYLSFPVSNQLVEYEEYYEITVNEFNDYIQNLDNAIPLLEKCKQHKEDHRLIQKPGNSRGTPI